MQFRLLAVYTSWQVGWQESAYLTSPVLLHWGKDIETLMYRIVKRIIRTVTTVTLLVRWEKGSPGESAREVPITLPASVSLMEEEVIGQTNTAKKRKKSKSALNVGEKL